MKLGSLLANYDVKPLSKFGGNRKKRTNSTSHPLSVSWGIPICKAGKQRVNKFLHLVFFEKHTLSEGVWVRFLPGGRGRVGYSVSCVVDYEKGGGGWGSLIGVTKIFGF